MTSHDSTPDGSTVKPICMLHTTGNTLLEYGLVASLVVAICIGIMMSLGNDLNSWMAGLKDDMDNKNKAASSQLQLQSQAQTAATAAKQSVSQAPLPETPNPVSTGQASGTIQTVGSNGTEALATQILNLAEQSLQSGAISQTDYNIIMQIANKGHTIGQIQGVFESARRASNGDVAAYNNYRYSINGQSYSLPELTSVLNQNISDFSALKLQASALPNVKRELSLLSAIQESGGQIIINGSDALDKNRSADNAVYVGMQENFDPNMPGNSGDTHQQSGHICTSGSYQDSGTQCSN